MYRGFDAEYPNMKSGSSVFDFPPSVAMYLACCDDWCFLQNDFWISFRYAAQLCHEPVATAWLRQCKWKCSALMGVGLKCFD